MVVLTLLLSDKLQCGILDATTSTKWRQAFFPSFFFVGCPESVTIISPQRVEVFLSVELLQVCVYQETQLEPPVTL